MTPELVINDNYEAAVSALVDAKHFVVIALDNDGVHWRTIISDKISHRTLLDVARECSDEWMMNLVRGTEADEDDDE